MKKKQITALLLSVFLIFGCSACAGNTNESSASSETSVSSAEPTPTEEPDVVPEDGVYTAEFKTDSSMFQANEACEGMGTLTVENGEMTFHVSLRSKKILNLYLGTAEDAKQNESEWLQPTTDTVTYKDGTSEEVYGFDIPLKSVDRDFDLALIGTKGTWYDHKVSVRNPQQSLRTPQATQRPKCRRTARIRATSRLRAVPAVQQSRAPRSSPLRTAK